MLTYDQWLRKHTFNYPEGLNAKGSHNIKNFTTEDDGVAMDFAHCQTCNEIFIKEIEHVHSRD